jgi:guanylate kinase
MILPGIRRQGVLFVVSAPSGTGKSTLCKSLRLTQDFHYSVSCTTRDPRPGEVHGEDYYFETEAIFKARIERGELIEWARVHDHYYGTLVSEVVDALRAGSDVLLDIDIQGARSIRESQNPIVKSSLADVFIMPPTLAELEARLRSRGTETEDEIRTRLERGREEMKVWKEYKYTILSGSKKDDYLKFNAIMSAERYLSSRLALQEERNCHEGENI